MPQLRGMRVNLNTHSDAGSGTDDHIYIGVVGSGGGREFPLATPNFSDFEEDTNVSYVLGTIIGPPPPGAMHPDGSEPGGNNDPQGCFIELSDVDYVYLRKQGSRSSRGDDAYQLEFVGVTLYANAGDDPESRSFWSSCRLWLGNEFGHQVWLREQTS